MQAALVAGMVAALTAVLLTPVVRKLAAWVGAVDQPGGRRVHAVATPRLGGIAIAIACMAAWVGSWGLSEEVMAAGGVELLPAFAVGGVLMLGVGAVDDVRALGAKRKLLLQILVASLAWALGCRVGPAVTLPLVGTFDLGMVGSYVATVVWILGFINAINLIDGLDGLAAGIVFFAAITNIVVAAVTGNVLAAMLNASLGGAVLGFLLYNWNPATIFMGDAGSLFIGYALGTGALLSNRQKESTLLSLLVPIVALGLPFVDTLVSMVRRFLAKRSIFAADRGHIHHRLIDLGFTQRKAVLTLYACSVALCAASVAVALGRDWQAGAAIVAAVATLGGLLRFSGALGSAILSPNERRAQMSLSAGELRAAVPEIIVELQSATSFPTVCSTVERALARTPSFTRASIRAHDDGVLWEWTAAAEAGKGGPDDSMVFPIQIFPGAPPGYLKFGFVAGEPRARNAKELLVMLVADAIEHALLRTHATRPAALVRAKSERTRTSSHA